MKICQCCNNDKEEVIRKNCACWPWHFTEAEWEKLKSERTANQTRLKVKRERDETLNNP